jgi:hypothetical protein
MALRQWEKHATNMRSRAIVRGAVAAGRYHMGLTAILRPAYCCQHMTHTLEPVTVLQGAMRRHGVKHVSNADDPRATTGRCREAKRCAIAPLDRAIFISSAAPTNDSWTWHATQAALAGSVDGRQDWARGPLPFLTNYGQFTPKPEVDCFEHAVVPGSLYRLFPNSEWADDFRGGVARHVSRLKAEMAPTIRPSDRWMLQSERDGRYVGFPQQERVILLALRGTNRRIKDVNATVKYIQRVLADPLGAVVNTIDFGAHEFAAQAAHVQRAGILVGMHGADLTNMVHLRKGRSAVVELNPLFFFESRFYEMAQMLSVAYFAWTCTNSSCAFSGDATRWRQLSDTMRRGTLHYNEATREFSGGGLDTFAYPHDQYNGGCLLCTRIACCSNLSATFYSTLRDSNVVLLPMANEWLPLLRQAAEHVGWTTSH